MPAAVHAEPMQVFGSMRPLDVRSLAGPVLDARERIPASLPSDAGHLPLTHQL